MTHGSGIDPEGEPTDRACNRCGEPLHTTPRIARDILACSACSYAECAPGQAPIGRLTRIARWVKRRLWPHTTAAGLAIAAVGIVTAVALFMFGGLSGSVSAALAGVGAYLGWGCTQLSASTRCGECGYGPLDSTAGFCANCGDALDSPWTDVDPDAVGRLEGHPLRERRSLPAWCSLPDGVDRTGIDLEVTATPTALVDRLLVGPTRSWRRVFTAGIAIAVVGQALLVGVLVSIGIDVLGGLVAPAPEPSTAGESTPEPLALPALDAELLATVAAGVAIGVAILFVSIALHELGHAMATRANGVALSEVSMSFTAGLVPTGGHMQDYDGRGDVTPLDRARTAAAGPLYSLLAGLVVAAPFLATGTLSGSPSAASLSTVELVGAVFVFINLASFFGNLWPAFGADGDHLVDALGEWLVDRRSKQAGESPTAGVDRLEGAE